MILKGADGCCLEEMGPDSSLEGCSESCLNSHFGDDPIPSSLPAYPYSADKDPVLAAGSSREAALMAEQCRDPLPISEIFTHSPIEPFPCSILDGTSGVSDPGLATTPDLGGGGGGGDGGRLDLYGAPTTKTTTSNPFDVIQDAASICCQPLLAPVPTSPTVAQSGFPSSFFSL